MITINIDLGSAQEVKVLVIYDHNLTSAATITLIGVDPTILNESITWAADKILHYLAATTTKRYWQLQITDDTNPDGYIRIGELFMGSYLELSKNYAEGFSKGFGLLYDENKTPYGVGKKRFYNRQRNFQYDYNYLLSADITLLEALLDAVADRDTGELNPFYFNEDSALPANNWLVDITELPEDHQERSYYKSSLQFVEVMRSV